MAMEARRGIVYLAPKERTVQYLVKKCSSPHRFPFRPLSLSTQRYSCRFYTICITVGPASPMASSRVSRTFATREFCCAFLK